MLSMLESIERVYSRSPVETGASLGANHGENDGKPPQLRTTCVQHAYGMVSVEEVLRHAHVLCRRPGCVAGNSGTI